MMHPIERHHNVSLPSSSSRNYLHRSQSPNHANGPRHHHRHSLSASNVFIQKQSNADLLPPPPRQRDRAFTASDVAPPNIAYLDNSSRQSSMPKISRRSKHNKVHPVEIEYEYDTDEHNEGYKVADRINPSKKDKIEKE